MNNEFQELLLNKAVGKLLQQIRVKDFCLGESLPVITNATVMKIQSRGADQVAQELDLALDIEYSGGFLLSLDAELIFGKTAYMAVKLNSLKGRLRLQFTRNPCTHWSFSFYDDPEMDLEVESQFNGKNLSKLTALIKSQIRKSVRRKHTLPRYKVRYKPFFRQPIPHNGKEEVFVHNSQVTVGKLDVEVLECTRLPELPMNTQLYCSVSIETLPWSEFMPKNSSLWSVHEVVMTRTLNGSLGVRIKPSQKPDTEHQHTGENRETIVIDTISPNSPASTLDIQRGDILLAINDVAVESMKQAIRLIKNNGDKPSCTPVVNIENQDVSESESRDEEVDGSTEVQQQQQPKDFESSFDYNNVTLDADDSDGEEFVNIIVQELEQQIANENVKEILRKVSQTSATRDADKTASVSFHEQARKKEIETECNKQSNKRSEENAKKAKGIIKEVNNVEDRSILNKDEKAFASMVSDNKEESNAKKEKQIQGFKMNIAEKERDASKDKTLEEERHGCNEGIVENETLNDTEASRNMQADRLKILHRKDNSIDLDNETSDFESENSNRTDADGGWDNISQYTLLNKDVDRPPTSQKTSLEPSWNESFSFDVEKQHRFLNVCVWSKSEEREDKDILLGYASVPLMEIALECLSTTSHKHVQAYFLNPSYNRSGVSKTNLRVLMPGLKPETCNGDINLAFCYKLNLQNCFLSEEELNQALDGYAHKNEEIEENQGVSESDNKLDTEKMHDFMGTHFYSSTRCDYCQKKVWTKTAFQCRVCAMISHKKCIANAHSHTYCTRMGVRAKPPSWRSETDTTSKKSNGIAVKGPLERREFDSISLQIPDARGFRSGFLSKPMSSPQLRKRFNRSNTLIQDEGFEHPLQRSLDSRDVDSIATAAETAKKAGKEIFSRLDEEDKQEKLEKLVQKMQAEMDEENQKRTEFCEMLETVTDKEKRAKIQSLMRKSEERTQALSLMMIQYCTALKECLKTEESSE
eukprot:gene6959-7744_t